MFRNIFLSLIIVCHLLSFVYAEEVDYVNFNLCHEKQDTHENECTYIEKAVESEILIQGFQSDESNFVSTIKQGLIDSHSVIYICVIPLSILTAPIAMIVAWGTIFYTVYHNDELAVFR